MTQNHCERSCIIQSFFGRNHFWYPPGNDHISPKKALLSRWFSFSRMVGYVTFSWRVSRSPNRIMGWTTELVGLVWLSDSLADFAAKRWTFDELLPPKLSLESRNSQAFTCHHFFFSVASIHFLQMEEALDIWPKFRKFHNREQWFQRLWKKTHHKVGPCYIVVNMVVSPLTGVMTPVTHKKRPFIGVITPFNSW